MFFGQIKPEEIVFDVFDRKECFLNQKSKVFKKAKKSKFFKGFSLKKVSKIKIFQRGKSILFFNFGQIKPEKNRFLILWREKNVFRPEM